MPLLLFGVALRPPLFDAPATRGIWDAKTSVYYAADAFGASMPDETEKVEDFPFAVYEDGSWRFYAKDPEAMTRTLDFCARQGKRCWLYAVDDRVVWSTDVNKRIGSSSQLGGGNAPVDPKDEHQ